jgi:hypothetical protein
MMVLLQGTVVVEYQPSGQKEHRLRSNLTQWIARYTLYSGNKAKLLLRRSPSRSEPCGWNSRPKNPIHFEPYGQRKRDGSFPLSPTLLTGESGPILPARVSRS